MTKFLFLLYAIMLIMSFCYSTPQTLLRNQVNLTPEQQIDFQQKIKDRPDDYSYNPMHVNDRWWFNTSGNISCQKSVINDTIINNVRMFQTSSFGSWNRMWICNQGDSVRFYDGVYNCDNNPNTDYLTTENFAISISDQSFSTYWVGLDPGLLTIDQIHVRYIYQDVCIVFGDTVTVKAYMYDEFGLPWRQWTLLWAQKFGMISIIGEFYTSNCVAAIIDNVAYGDSSVDSGDSNITGSQQMYYTAFPNPFRNKTTITYNLTKQTQVKLDFFNIKGQRVRSLENRVKDSGSQTVNWDGTNDRGLALPNGIYFCRLITPDQVQTIKLVLLK